MCEMSAALEFHKKLRGKLEIISKQMIKTREDLSLAYTPGVAEASLAIAEDTDRVYSYTMKGNTVAIITDGSAVLGLGNVGPEAALPVMEGKAVLFKQFANIDAFPICLATQETEEIIHTIRHIAPVFGGINLEDISAPRCFEIEEQLQDLGIPVMHDDQHGTAVVVLAGLLNACKITGKNFGDCTIVINGAGAAGTAVAKIILMAAQTGILSHEPPIVLCDSQGILSRARHYGHQNKYKAHLAEMTNKKDVHGSLQDALHDADIFIGVSKANLLTEEMVQSMHKNPIIFAMANPVPEIMPDKAKKAGAAIVATGRSDFPNQVNNALVFPGIFRGVLDCRASRITGAMKLAAVQALAATVKNPTANNILPSVLDPEATKNIAAAVKNVGSKIPFDNASKENTSKE